MCCAGVPDQEFDAGAINAVLEQLTPQKLRMMLASKRFKVRTAHAGRPPGGDVPP